MCVSWLGSNYRLLRENILRRRYLRSKGAQIGLMVYGLSISALSSLMFSAVDAASPFPAYYYSSGNFGSLDKEGTLLTFKSYLGNSTERKIYSNFSQIIWSATEYETEDLYFSVSGPEGLLFSVDNAGAVWGYHTNPAKLDIFSMNDRGIVSSVPEPLHPIFSYKAFLVRPGHMKAYDCDFDVSSYVVGDRIKINGHSLKIPSKSMIYDLVGEIPEILAKGGVNLNRDKCHENPEYLSELAKQYNAKGLVQVDH